MRKNGKGLAIFAIILGLIGAGTGGYLFIKNNALEAEIINLEEDITDLEDTIEEMQGKILPKARIYYDDSTFWILHNTGRVIEFTNSSYDTHNAFNFTDSSYLIPESGFYQINAQFSIEAEAGDDFVIYIMRNNTFHSFRRYAAPITINNFGCGISDKVNATVGDTIRIRGFYYGTSSTVRYVSGGENFSYFTIAKLP